MNLGWRHADLTGVRIKWPGFSYIHADLLDFEASITNALTSRTSRALNFNYDLWYLEGFGLEGANFGSLSEFWPQFGF